MSCKFWLAYALYILYIDMMSTVNSFYTFSSIICLCTAPQHYSTTTTTCFCITYEKGLTYSFTTDKMLHWKLKFLFYWQINFENNSTNVFRNLFLILYYKWFIERWLPDFLKSFKWIKSEQNQTEWQIKNINC